MWHFNNIPKVAHFFWSGAKLPYLRYFTLLSFKKLNLDWKIHLHTEELPWANTNVADWSGREQKVVYRGASDYFDEALNLADKVIFHNFKETNVAGKHSAIKSDWLRWKLLSEEGGLWSDLDILYNHSIDNLEENVEKNTNISSTINFDRFHSIGFLLSSPGDIYYKKLYNSAQTTTRFSYQTIGSPLAKIIYESVKPTNTINLNNQCVYSLISNDIEQNLTKPLQEVAVATYSWTIKTGNGQDLLDNKKVIGLHWFGGRAEVESLYSMFETNSIRKDSILGRIRSKFV